MESLKNLKRGDVLFKEGELVNSLYIIKSGKISLKVERPGKKIEVMTLTTSQVLGEQCLIAPARQGFTAVAESPVTLFEVPAEIIKQQHASSPAGMKLLAKSLIEEVKQLRATVRSNKLEQDSSPCPQMVIPKLFSLLNLVARTTGEPLEEGSSSLVLDWSSLKLYSTRMFLEAPSRMRGVSELLTKLGYADLQFSKSEDGEEELSKIVIHNIKMVEDFAEFYQYHLYKAGRSEMIYPDALTLKTAKAFTELAAEEKVDHRGGVRMEYDKVLQDLKSKYRFDLKSTHLNMLERKGLFAQRQSTDEAVFLRFDKEEFERVVGFWEIIHEIDKWNEKGFVDLSEKPEVVAQEGGASQCPECQGDIQENHRFCPQCGFKMAA